MGKDLTKVKATFFFCDGGSCQKAGSEDGVRNARAYLRNNGLQEKVHTIKTRCNGRCEDAPTLILQEGNFWYKKINGDKAVEIMKSHLQNDKPVEEYLLFKPDFESVKSDKERGSFNLKPFEQKVDEELGDCFIMKGFSSDQYLHPLFLYLVENPEDAKINYPDGKTVLFSDVTELRYTKKFELELDTDKGTLEFVISPIPKERVDLLPFKITTTEYFYRTEADNVGLRFRNKKGETIATIELGNAEGKAWKYCTEVQLQNNEISTVKV